MDNNLENKYRIAQESEEAVVANIRKACSDFMRRHPEYLSSKRNEDILFAAMSAPENDHLSPVSVASWEDVYAQRREQLEVKPRREQRSVPASGLTRTEIDTWSSIRMQKEIESSPRRAQEIETALSRR